VPTVYPRAAHFIHPILRRGGTRGECVPESGPSSARTVPLVVLM
jgi:hypothetical protein